MANPRKSLLDRVLDGSFEASRHAYQMVLEPLPAEPPVDNTRPLLRDRWHRLIELQSDYTTASELERKTIQRELNQIVREVAAARREPDSLYEFVTSVIGPHPRSASGKRRPPGGKRFARFCSEFLVHTKGRWAGDPLVLERHQVVEANQIFAADPATGLRVVQEAYIQEPKKNGKSTRASGVAGYLLCADDEPGPEVYGGATDKEQAKLVFLQLVAMLEKSRLRPFVRIYRDAIEVPSVGGFYKVIAADAISDEGINMSGGVLDELHHHDRPDLYEMMSRSGDAREQPLLYVITNAPADEDPDSGVCARVRGMGLAVIRGDKDARDDMYASIDEVGDDELENRRAWMRVNKASWITVQLLERQRKKSRPADWMRYRMNRPTSDGEDGFLPAGAWEACQGAAEIPRGAPVIAAVDFATYKDTASVGWEARRPDWADGQPGEYLVSGHVWGVAPKDTSGSVPPAHVVLPAGDQVTFTLVEDKLRWLASEYDLQVVLYDPWRFARSAELLRDEGVNMVEFPQSNERTGAASEDLFDDIITQRVMHAGDEVLSAHVRNAATRSIGRGWRLDKTKTRRAMDWTTTLMMMHAVSTVELVAASDSAYTIRF